MRPFRSLLYLTSFFTLFHASAVMAATVSDTAVFRMANGSYYHPGTGKMAATEELLLALISGTSPPATPVTPVATTVAAATVLDTTVFRMANGSYYHPGTGKIAATEELLLALISGNSAPVTPTTPVATTNTQTPALREAVERARILLQERIDGGLIERKIVSVADVSNTWFPVTLAVWNPSTGQLSVHEVLRRETSLKQVNGTPVTFVSVKNSNGVNSEYVIRDQESVVVANIHPILKRLDATKYELAPVIYTPYSDALHTSAMVAWGKTYLQTVIDGVYRDLRASGVMSLAFRDRLLADVIDPEMVRAITVIEHSDNNELKRSPVRTVEQVYVTLAGNDQDTYAYARSSAGALGLVQFIPSTYTWLRQQRPSLGLIADFEQAMRDPKNAVRAQIAYLDILIREMPEITPAVFDTNRDRVQEYLVAAYNGGSGKVRRAMTDWEGAIQGRQMTTLAELTKRHVSLDAQIAALQKKIKATTNKTTLATLKTQLASLQKEHDKVVVDETFYKKFALREETRTYIVKYRNALSALQQLDKTVQIASR